MEPSGRRTSSLDTAPGRSALATALVIGTALVVIDTVARPFTWPADISTGAAIVLVVAYGLRFGRHLSRRRVPIPPTTRRSIVTWLLVVAALAAVELIEYAQAPRRLHPTISSIFDVINSHKPLKALVLIAWMAWGVWLCLGWLGKPREGP